jgi:eukaryotic-like serine/threonine-protein kinase
MAIEPGRVKALFQAAIDLEDASEREAFLDREAGGETELRARLNALLAAYHQPGGMLDQPLAPKIDDDLAAARPIPDETTDRQGTTARPNEAPAGLPDSVIAGRYKLRQEIGEGGMGTVYLAEQTQPVKRMVALKLIKAGTDSKTVLARYRSSFAARTKPAASWKSQSNCPTGYSDRLQPKKCSRCTRIISG